MRAALLAAAVAVMLAWPPRARADGGPDPRRAQAAERFDRAMALLDEGDNAAALDELRRVYALAPHPQVLYNLGLVYATLDRPVEATRALDDVLAAPGALPAASLDRARRTRDEQARHVARLDVSTNVPAAIAIDGVEVGTTPLDGPVAVAAGAHVVEATGSGYLAARREITVAGETTEQLRLELPPPGEPRLAGDAAKVKVNLDLVGAPGGRLAPAPEVHADDEHRAGARRRWGWAAALGGLTIGAGAAAVVALNRGPLRDAQANTDRILGQSPCLDARQDRSAMAPCAALLRAADDRFNTHQTIQNLGLVALAAGTVAAGTGAALLLTARDPARDERTPRDLAPPALSAWLAPDGGGGLGAGGLAVAGRF
jgi:hypothetical protein